MLSALAAEHAVDIVLIAGDLFDHQRVKEPIVAEAFAVLGALQASGVECVVLCGNHDAHDDGSILFFGNALLKLRRELEMSSIRFGNYDHAARFTVKPR